MRPFESVISLEEAQRRLAAAIRPIARTERVPIAAAAGRVAAEDVTSPMDVPPFARAAMDGYAVLAADTAGASGASPRPLRIVERLYAGRPGSRTITAGTCAEVATGAPLPAGADAVLMVEDTRPAGPDEALACAAVSAGQNVGRRGSDFCLGDVVVRAGELLTPGRVGALAAVGRAALEVFARPRAAILSTGNEVVPPGGELRPGQIFDVNRFTLSALVDAHGGIAEPREPVEDSVDALGAALDAGAGADLIVFSGGSSVGERDLLVDALAGRGETVFHGVAIKPGKPTVFALVRGVPFFGMPGNPTSCLSNAYVLLLPFLRALARLPPHAPRTIRAPLGRRVASQAGRHQFCTVRLDGGVAMPVFKGSGDITSLSQADGYIEIAAGQTAAEEGALVDVVLFGAT